MSTRFNRRPAVSANVRRRFALLVGAVCGLPGASALATSLRIASYNIDDADQGNDNNITASYAGLPATIQAMGLHTMAGNAQPIDVLGVEELNSTTLPNLVAALNVIYGAGTYDYDRTADPTTGGGTDGLIYNTHTVQILSSVAVGTVSTSGAARAPLRYQIQPVGYGTSASFFMYVSHYKASSGSSNEARRNVEATTIRADADALGPNAHIIYSGDFNLSGGSGESAYATLTAAGNGRAYDPTAANATTPFVSTWTNNSNQFKNLYSESTTGLDSRFDFQLVSGAMLNQPGVQLAPDTIDTTSPVSYPYAYQIFGNNGTTAVGALTNGSGNTSVNDLANPTTVLNNLMEGYAGNSNEFVGSDHLPLLADYNIVGVSQVPIFWLGGTSTWSTAAKWSTTVVPNNSSIKLLIDSGNPTGSIVTLDQNALVQDLALDANDALIINAGKTLTLNGPTNSTFSGRLNNGGTLAIAGGMAQLLSAGTHAGVFIISTGATLDLHGGTQTFSTDASFSGGGQVLLSGAAGTASRLMLGAGGAGDAITVTQSAGTFTIANDAYLGNAASSVSTYALTSGTLSIGGLTHVGYSGTGHFTQSAGILSAATLTVGENAGGIGTFALSGTGALTVGNAYVGGSSTAAGGSGAVTISGGSATITSTLKLWNAASSVTLSGGALTTGTLSVTGGTFTQTAGTFATTSLLQTGGIVSLSGQSAYTIPIVSISAGTTVISADGAKLLTTSSLVLSGTGRLDLANNDLLIHTSTPDAFRMVLSSGYNNGVFNAPGITSSYAPAHPSQGLGAISGTDFLAFHPGQTFDGVTVATDDVLVKYTYLGDATLDGVISVDDYLQIDRGYTENLTGWVNGDFNYSGAVDFHDYALIDAAITAQGGPLAADVIAAHTAAFGEPYLEALSADEAAVPEPASLIFLSAAFHLLLKRRRRERGTGILPVK